MVVPLSVRGDSSDGRGSQPSDSLLADRHPAGVLRRGPAYGPAGPSATPGECCSNRKARRLLVACAVWISEFWLFASRPWADLTVHEFLGGVPAIVPLPNWSSAPSPPVEVSASITIPAWLPSPSTRRTTGPLSASRLVVESAQTSSGFTSESCWAGRRASVVPKMYTVGPRRDSYLRGRVRGIHSYCLILVRRWQTHQ